METLQVCDLVPRSRVWSRKNKIAIFPWWPQVFIRLERILICPSGRAWQNTFPIKKSRAKWIGPTHLALYLDSVLRKACLKDSWRRGPRSLVVLVGAQNCYRWSLKFSRPWFRSHLLWASFSSCVKIIITALLTILPWGLNAVLYLKAFNTMPVT